MDRRDFVLGVGTLAASGLAARSITQAQAAGHAAGHAAHAAAGSAKPPAPSAPMTPELRAIIEATLKCMQNGELCLAHCTDNLASGDQAMASCQRAVMNMLAVCEATFKTASYRSADPKHLKALARTCGDFCRACAKACEPHAAHHDECKHCGESCVDCAKACDGVAK